MKKSHILETQKEMVDLQKQIKEMQGEVEQQAEQQKVEKNEAKYEALKKRIHKGCQDLIDHLSKSPVLSDTATMRDELHGQPTQTSSSPHEWIQTDQPQPQGSNRVRSASPSPMLLSTTPIADTDISDFLRKVENSFRRLEPSSGETLETFLQTRGEVYDNLEKERRAYCRKKLRPYISPHTGSFNLPHDRSKQHKDRVFFNDEEMHTKGLDLQISNAQSKALSQDVAPTVPETRGERTTNFVKWMVRHEEKKILNKKLSKKPELEKCVAINYIAEVPQSYMLGSHLAKMLKDKGISTEMKCGSIWFVNDEASHRT